MTFPSPDDLAGAPAWDNYVVSQASYAALGAIPVSALAVGVRIQRERVQLVFQLPRITQADREDMQEVCDELQMLLGLDIDVQAMHDLRVDPDVSADTGVQWFYRRSLRS